MLRFARNTELFDTVQWFKDGDHRGKNQAQSNVVRAFRESLVDENKKCNYCKNRMYRHGWLIPELGTGTGTLICPGDWILEDKHGEFSVCKSGQFKTIYTEVKEKLRPTIESCMPSLIRVLSVDRATDVLRAYVKHQDTLNGKHAMASPIGHAAILSVELIRDVLYDWEEDSTGKDSEWKQGQAKWLIICANVCTIRMVAADMDIPIRLRQGGPSYEEWGYMNDKEKKDLVEVGFTESDLVSDE